LPTALHAAAFPGLTLSKTRVGKLRRQTPAVRYFRRCAARVSTADQNPDHQIDALRHAGVAEKDIYIDHASGAKASRPQLDNVLRMLREGDTLKITRLDRLGRSVLHLVTLGAELRERGVGLPVIEQGIDTTTAEGRAMFGMLSVLAELQRELIVANTRDGTRRRARSWTQRRPPTKTHPRADHLRPAALRHRRAHRPADRRPLQRSPHHRLRAPRRHHQRASAHTKPAGASTS
jgi:DNA invertase Pin-like site-specific DNA recombinase